MKTTATFRWTRALLALCCRSPAARPGRSITRPPPAATGLQGVALSARPQRSSSRTTELEGRPASDAMRGNWWEIFHDPELNALEEQLNINNQNIKVYFENFMEARALIREARAQYCPTASAHPATVRDLGKSRQLLSSQYRDKQSPWTPFRSTSPGSPICGERSAMRCASTIQSAGERSRS